MGELARAADDAWRISLADVDRDGRLPTLAGRTLLLTVVDGPVLAIVLDGETHVVEPHRPFALTGDAAVTVSAPDGAVRVLDVSVDPQLVRPIVTVLELGRTSVLPLAEDQAAYVVKGAAASSLVVGPGEVEGRCTVAVITLRR